MLYNVRDSGHQDNIDIVGIILPHRVHHRNDSGIWNDDVSARHDALQPSRDLKTHVDHGVSSGELVVRF